jgi:hypothetical protein
VLSFAKRRGAWVSVRHQRLQGLVGARPRGGSEAWEIDYLLDTTKDYRLTAELLEHATMEAGKEGAHKLFLRLAAHSVLLPSMQEAGFTAYQEETLYSRADARGGDSKGLRPFVASDSYPLFRLYCETRPEAVRRLEAATFGEWHASQERRWLRSGVHLVQECDGGIVVQVLAARWPQGLLVEISGAAGALDDVDGLIGAAGAAAEAAGSPVHVLVPNTADDLSHRLEITGFTAEGEYVSLMRRTTKPLTLPRTVAVVAENAIGV